MDDAKCRSLKSELASQPTPQIVPIARFFDGNDDVGSIGCNLMNHPGIERFRSVLVGLTRHPKVTAVYAQISELDPGEEFWPFSDLVVVVGDIPIDELRKLVSELEPDVVAAAESSLISLKSAGLHKDAKSATIWWD